MPRPRFWSAVSLLLAAEAAMGAAQQAPPNVEIEISGIEEPLLGNVESFLTIRELQRGLVTRLTGAARPVTVTADEIRRRHRAAPQQIRAALQPFGYYQPQIDADLSQRERTFVARYRIDPGQAARLGAVNLQVRGEGSDHPAIRDALAAIDLASGQQLEHARYDAAKDSLFDATYTAGYLDAVWRDSQIRVAPDRLSADLDLVLDTGPRFYFGDTSIRQQVLDPDFMAGFNHIEPGEAYDVDKLLDLQRTLSETDYFSRVEVRAPRAEADASQRIPVTVIAEPAKPQKYTLGLGYGTDTGPRTTLGVLLRRVNARGHRLRGDLQLSTIEQAIGARYEIPIRNYATDSLSFSATARKEEIGDAETEQIALGASHVVSWFGFRRRLYVQAEREQFSFGEEPTRETDLVYPGITLSRERADNVQYPRRGYSLRTDLRAGVESLLSEVSFTRLELTTRWTRGLGASTRLLLRAEAGALWTDDFADLPPSQRFFAGGDRSIRGYAYQEVGPRNVEDEVIGGERMVAASIELEHLFVGSYGAAVFVDAGDAFDSAPELKLGAGIGFRWRSPIGMLRFDVAHPFDDPDSDFRIHLTIGADL